MSFYTDEENTLVLISLLKQHCIKKIIVSPGTTNISFVASIQTDSWFDIFSAVDERAAAYMACGLAEESGEIVAITCTGATASRNYLPGLTEAYYRKLPILAITYTQHIGKIGNNVAQVLDRSKQFRDMCKMSATIPSICCDEDRQWTITKINEVILELNHGSKGPCHLNMVTTYSNKFVVNKLPKYRKITRHFLNSMPELDYKSIGIFIGSHAPFSNQETNAIDDFCKTNNAIVISDHVGNYHGKYKLRSSLVGSQHKDFGLRNFDLIIYIGHVHGAYLPFFGKELWRVCSDGIIRDPYKNISRVFEMNEIDFFNYYKNGNKTNSIGQFADKTYKDLFKKIPELPFSNLWIAKETCCLIPKNSIVHFAILNSLRSWNYFNIDDSVNCFANTGGYGIDGCLSSFLGSARASKTKEHYLIIGDLSFFYDINTLFNGLTSNAHIMLINNGIGTEFKNYNHRAAYFGKDADNFIAAKGHNGYKNVEIVKNICQNLNVMYLFANSKTKYLEVKDEWIAKHDAPVLLEVFTDYNSESEALKIINSIAPDDSLSSKFKRSIIGRIIKRVLRR